MSVTKRYFSVLYNVKTVFEKPAFGLDRLLKIASIRTKNKAA